MKNKEAVCHFCSESQLKLCRSGRPTVTFFMSETQHPDIYYCGAVGVHLCSSAMHLSARASLLESFSKTELCKELHALEKTLLTH